MRPYSSDLADENIMVNYPTHFSTFNIKNGIAVVCSSVNSNDYVSIFKMGLPISSDSMATLFASRNRFVPRSILSDVSRPRFSAEHDCTVRNTYNMGRQTIIVETDVDGGSE